MTVVRQLIQDLRPVQKPARVLYWGAAFWLISAIIHIFPLAADGWAWSGAVSFRKPIAFSLSVGLLLATAGWVLDRLPERPRLQSALAWTFLGSSSIEVGLIAVQAWRGRASHFNTFEAGDAAIFVTMGVMVGVMSLCLVALLVWSILRRPSDPLVAIAVIGGMTLVATGLGFGQWIIELGNDYVETRSAVPNTVHSGAGGVAKFPHAVAFHGIQLFILTAVALRRGSHTEPVRRRVMWLTVLAYSGILLFASAQTIAGRPPLEPGVWLLGMVLSVIATGFAVVLALCSLATTSTDEEPAVPVA